MKRLIPIFGLILIFCGACLLNSGCKNASGSQLDFDTQLDSVHMGVQLGMGRQAFYDHCWDLNKQGKNITQGHHNTSVMYMDSLNFKYPVDVNFYPTFNEENKIYILPVRYEYKSWAPWNKEAYSDKLLVEVIELMEKSYHCTFEKKMVNETEVWFNHTPPRLITIYEEDDHYVFVKFKNETYK